MASFRSWVSNVADAVRNKDSRTLCARVDWMDHMAQTVAMSQQPTMPQLQQQAGERFRFIGANAERWSIFAAAHIGAKVAANAGRKQDAFELYHKAVQTFRSVMDSDDSAEWLEPSAILIVKTFAALAKQGHSAGSNAPEGSKVLRDACEEIRRLVNSCVRHDKVHLLLVSTVILYKFYHRMGAIFLMKDLKDPIERVEKAAALAPILSACPPGELCSYRFFHGMLFVMDDQLQDAQKQLDLALRLLPRGPSKNRTAVLSYLVPVAMLQGRMPRSSMLKQNGLTYFLPLVEALKAGNPVAVEDALLQEEKRYMRAGTYVVMQKLHMLAFRQMLRKIHICQLEEKPDHSKINLHVVHAVLKRAGVDMPLDEVECMVSNLIVRKLVKGYISSEHKILVVAKGAVSKAFPPITAGSLQR